MGSFHLLDGAKVRVTYQGQRRTCGRCHKTSFDCPGKGLARACEANNGNRVSLLDHMKSHWSEIGFSPETFLLENDDTLDNEDGIYDVPLKENQQFTPTHKADNINVAPSSIYNGVVVRNLPPDISDEDTELFVISKGMPKDHKAFRISVGKKK